MLRARRKQRSQLEAVTLENKLLREKIDLLIRRIFGKSSETLDEQQLLMLLQGGDDGAEKATASNASPGLQRKPRRLGV